MPAATPKRGGANNQKVPTRSSASVTATVLGIASSSASPPHHITHNNKAHINNESSSSGTIITSSAVLRAKSRSREGDRSSSLDALFAQPAAVVMVMNVRSSGDNKVAAAPSSSASSSSSSSFPASPTTLAKQQTVSALLSETPCVMIKSRRGSQNVAGSGGGKGGGGGAKKGKAVAETKEAILSQAHQSKTQSSSTTTAASSPSSSSSSSSTSQIDAVALNSLLSNTAHTATAANGSANIVDSVVPADGAVLSQQQYPNENIASPFSPRGVPAKKRNNTNFTNSDGIITKQTFSNVIIVEEKEESPVTPHLPRLPPPVISKRTPHHHHRVGGRKTARRKATNDDDDDDVDDDGVHHVAVISDNEDDEEDDDDNTARGVPSSSSFSSSHQFLSLPQSIAIPFRAVTVPIPLGNNGGAGEPVVLRPAPQGSILIASKPKRGSRVVIPIPNAHKNNNKSLLLADGGVVSAAAADGGALPSLRLVEEVIVPHIDTATAGLGKGWRKGKQTPADQFVSIQKKKGWWSRPVKGLGFVDVSSFIFDPSYGPNKRAILDRRRALVRKYSEKLGSTKSKAISETMGEAPNQQHTSTTATVNKKGLPQKSKRAREEAALAAEKAGYLQEKRLSKRCFVEDFSSCNAVGGGEGDGRGVISDDAAAKNRRRIVVVGLEGFAL